MHCKPCTVLYDLRSPGIKIDSDIIASEESLTCHLYFFLVAKRRKLTFCLNSADIYLIVSGSPFEVVDNECTGLHFHFLTGREPNLIRGQLMDLKTPQRSAKHREPSALPPNILHNAVLQIPRLFRHCHRLGK